MYEIGKVYVWQNQQGPFAHLNGVECTVLGPPVWGICIYTQSWQLGQETDTPSPQTGCGFFAGKGDLRRKDLPSGEQGILSLFTNPAPVLETA